MRIVDGRPVVPLIPTNCELLRGIERGRHRVRNGHPPRAACGCSPDGDLTRLTARGGVPGANGIALSSDEALLYVSWDLGIAVVERATGSVRDLRPPAGATLTGIDGLEYSRGRLVAIQPYLERVSMFGLSRDGWRVDETVVLLSRHADLVFPTAVGDGTPLPLDDLTGPIVLKIALPD